MEYEKELQLKTVQCQEMDNALKLEQNLNTKLYDDVSVCLYIAQTKWPLLIVII